MPYVMPQDLRGEFVLRDYLVPYSSLPAAQPELAGNFVAAPGVVSSHDVTPGMAGTFVETEWVQPPFRSTPAARLGQDFMAQAGQFFQDYKWPILGITLGLLLLGGGAGRKRRLF